MKPNVIILQRTLIAPRFRADSMVHSMWSNTLPGWVYSTALAVTARVK